MHNAWAAHWCTARPARVRRTRVSSAHGAFGEARLRFVARRWSGCRPAGTVRPIEAPTSKEPAMSLNPFIAVHVTAAIAATVIGPFALWARLGREKHPRLHRAFGYAWVTLMVLTAISAIFISDPVIPNLRGFGPIHLLIPVVLGLLFVAFRYLAKGNIAGHRKTMQNLYIVACLVAGSFTLLPDRLLGQLVWGQWLSLLA
jgi:uncharacterized membrane protein